MGILHKSEGAEEFALILSDRIISSWRWIVMSDEHFCGAIFQFALLMLCVDSPLHNSRQKREDESLDQVEIRFETQ
jgi:hypothetical protein